MAGFGAVFGSDDLCKLLFGHFAAAYFKERADYGANHIPQETVGCDDKIGLVIIFYNPPRFFDVADGCFDICMRAAERSKVLFAE